MNAALSLDGIVVLELEVEHIVLAPVAKHAAADDLIARCRAHIARIDELLAQSRALRAATAA